MNPNRLHSAPITVLVTLLMVATTQALNFPLTRTRETCFVVTQGNYEIEYVVSGQSEK